MRAFVQVVHMSADIHGMPVKRMGANQAVYLLEESM